MSVANLGAHGTLSKSISLIGSATAASVSSIDITPSQAYSRSNRDVWLVMWFLENSTLPASGATASGNGLTWEFITDASWAPATGNFRYGRAAGAATADQSIGTVTVALTGTNDYVWAGLFEVHGGTAMKAELWPTASDWPYWVLGSGTGSNSPSEAWTGLNQFAQYSVTANGDWENAAQAFLLFKTNTEAVTATTSAFEPTPNTWYGLTADPGGQITMPGGTVSLDIVNREGIATNSNHGVRWDWTTAAAYAEIGLRWRDRTNYTEDFDTTQWDGGSVTPSGALTATFLAFVEMLGNAIAPVGALTADLLTTIVQAVSGSLSMAGSLFSLPAKYMSGVVTPTSRDGSSPSTFFRFTDFPVSIAGSIAPVGAVIGSLRRYILSSYVEGTRILTEVAEGAQTLVAKVAGTLGLTAKSEGSLTLTQKDEDTSLSLPTKEEIDL